MRFLRPYEELMDTNPLLRLVVPFMIGIGLGDLVYEVLEWNVHLLFLVSFVVFLGGVLFYRSNLSFNKKTNFFLCCLNSCMFLLGMSVLVMDRNGLQRNWPAEKIPFRLLVTESPKELNKIWRVTGEIKNGACCGSKVNINLMRHGPSSSDSCLVALESPSLADLEWEKHIHPGDVLLLFAHVSNPKNTGNPGEFDFASWLRRQSVSGTAFCQPSEWKKSEYKADLCPFHVRLLRWRDRMILQYGNYFDGRHLAILSAMTLGDKTRLDVATRNIFSQTGVSHVLALSGLHLSILYSIYQILILSFCRRRWMYLSASVTGIGGLWLFAILAGLPLSLMRAALMYSVMLIMGCFRHDNFSINNMSLAALILLFISPQSLFDVGFQLSFLSVFFIILFARNFPSPCWIRRNRFLKIFYDAFAVSCCAQLATAPLVAYYFHNVPIYGFLSNWLAIPLAYLILSVAFLFFIFPLAQPLLSSVIDFLLSVMDSALTSLSQLPGASLEIHPTLMFVFGIYLLYILSYRYVVYRKKTGLYLSVIVLILMSGYEICKNRINTSYPCIVIYNQRRVPVLHAMVTAKESYILTTDSLRADSALGTIKNTYWRNDNISWPRWLKLGDTYESIYYNGSVMQFDGCRIAICNESLPHGKVAKPLPVDYLWITRGAKDSLSLMLNYYLPKKVVLDGSLTAFYTRKYRSEIERRSFPFYDIKEEGALVIKHD